MIGSVEQLFSHAQLEHPAVHPQLFSVARQKGKARVMPSLFSAIFEPINETAGESFFVENPVKALRQNV